MVQYNAALLAPIDFKRIHVLPSVYQGLAQDMRVEEIQIVTGDGDADEANRNLLEAHIQKASYHWIQRWLPPTA